MGFGLGWGRGRDWDGVGVTVGVTVGAGLSRLMFRREGRDILAFGAYSRTLSLSPSLSLPLALTLTQASWRPTCIVWSRVGRGETS